MQRIMNDSWAAIMVIGAFIAGRMLANLPLSNKWEPGWEMLSALGTIAATVAAIWIAGNEGRRRRSEAKERAIVLSARVYLPLATYAGKVKNVSDWFENNKPNGYYINGFLNTASALNDLMNNKVVADH
ncbi:MAG: hypothetical protein J0653_08130, partial [Deltaproteobacteria bacterium]|nr:hypothetical protein [Deltaproteobacteria bacterium]